MREGPVAKLLAPYIARTLEEVMKRVGPDFKRVTWWADDDWEALVREKWIGTLSRILLSIQRYGHGGALLLIPTDSSTDLSKKYALCYSVLEPLVVQDAVSDIRNRLAWFTVHDDYCDENKDLIPIDLYFETSIAGHEKSDAVEAIDGAIATIASFSRVDGLVVAADGLQITGFGAEITNKIDPPSAYSAGDAKASVSKLKKLDAKHWGTRHRSMMRYCFAHPGSLGFVISQDGDVRGVARIRDRLIIWEQIKLQNVSLPEPKELSKAIQKRARIKSL
jgi:hypothetical protein